MKRLASLISALALVSAVPATASAQEHAASTAALSALSTEAGSARASDEARVAQLLERPEVVEAARTAGVDIERVRTASRTLADEDLRRVAVQADAAEALLIQADQVVISTTAIIIGLLVLILIIVA